MLTGTSVELQIAELYTMISDLKCENRDRDIAVIDKLESKVSSLQYILTKSLEDINHRVEYIESKYQKFVIQLAITTLPLLLSTLYLFYLMFKKL